MKMKLNLLYLPVVFLLTASSLWAQVEPVDKDNVAIGGYDVVAYFSGAAVKGDPSVSAMHQGITYHFSSIENRKKFMKDPTAFLPQYGGYCAWGVAEKSSKFPVDPETFKVTDGKLYLFFNGPFNGSTFNSLDQWNANETELLKKGDENWQQLSASH